MRPAPRFRLAAALAIAPLFIAPIAAAAAASPASAAAASDSAASDSAAFPAYQGYVTDASGVLDASDIARLDALSQELDEKTSAELAIAIVPSFQPLDPSDYAVKLFGRWGVGRKGKDNGILITVATQDHRLWIEVGYGLEGTIPDAIASRIYREVLQPAFRQNDYAGGLYAAASEIAARIAKEDGVTLGGLDTLRAAPRRNAPSFPFNLSPLILLIIFLLLFRRRGVPWWIIFFLGGGGGRGRGGFGGGSGGFGGFGGGGGGGGFGGFGGGMTGGGGAGGGW